MKEIFTKGLYETIVKGNKEIYKNMLEDTAVDKHTTDYMERVLNFYNELSIENKELLLNIIEQIMIDTISNILGVIDGSSNLDDYIVESKLLLDGVDTEGELQDLFLEYIAENRE